MCPFFVASSRELASIQMCLEGRQIGILLLLFTIDLRILLARAYAECWRLVL